MSIARTAAPCAPAPAERVRTILAATDSLTVTTVGACEEIMTGAAMELDTEPRLCVPADCHIAGVAAHAPRAGIPAVLEWTDIAPVPVRDRVRARVRVETRLHTPEPGPSDTVRLRADLLHLTYEADGRGALCVAPRALADVRPDPLAGAEARLLLHLAESHHAHVAALARLVDAARIPPDARVTPLALDRYGIVLRFDHDRGHQDVRLPFRRPLTGPDGVGHHIHALLAHAHRHHGED